MEVQGWKAYYADGSVYDSSSYAWEDLPKNGIVSVILYHEEPYRTLVTHGDWIYLDDSGVPTATDTEKADGWADPPSDVPLKHLKRGVQISNSDWVDTQRKMMEDKEWP